jgi:hypothetical protein
LLGFDPQIALEQGMRRTEIWLRQDGYLPQGSAAPLASAA